jgi:hypothetical protein
MTTLGDFLQCGTEQLLYPPLDDNSCGVLFFISAEADFTVISRAAVSP